ncbi:3-galactosyl-N-acetylglucosaminide 4-alpha-L-fucosyltransferase FUT3-like [Rhinophrynus dorsalis]
MTLKPYIQKNMIFIVPILFLVFLISFAVNRIEFIPRILQCQEVKEVHQDKNLNLTHSTQKSEKDLLILVWVYPFGEHFPLDTCERVYGISGCKLTDNRELYSVADALVMHHVDIMYDKNSLPQQPRPHYQRWVWFNMEPPLIIKNLHFLDNLFNMTMTFRQDSDVYRPYGRIEALKEPQNYTIPAKSKLVAWVVSQWYPGAPRIAYYEELKKHIPIDVYGKKHMKLSWDDFYTTISQYKFYLAFENSIYKDYITEKFWRNAFDSWAVPVVLGTSRKNYERFMPGDAFIHVNDFSSHKELADFLLQLDKDDERYRKYFNWRSHYHVRRESGWDNNYCKACRALRQAPDYQVIPSVAKWFLEDV